MATRRIQVVLTEQMYAAIHTESIASGLSMGTLCRVALRGAIAQGAMTRYSAQALREGQPTEATETARARSSNRKPRI